MSNDIDNDVPSVVFLPRTATTNDGNNNDNNHNDDDDDLSTIDGKSSTAIQSELEKIRLGLFNFVVESTYNDLEDFEEKRDDDDDDDNAADPIMNPTALSQSFYSVDKTDKIDTANNRNSTTKDGSESCVLDTVFDEFLEFPFFTIDDGNDRDGNPKEGFTNDDNVINDDDDDGDGDDAADPIRQINDNNILQEFSTVDENIVKDFSESRVLDSFDDDDDDDYDLSADIPLTSSSNIYCSDDFSFAVCPSNLRCNSMVRRTNRQKINLRTTIERVHHQSMKPIRMASNVVMRSARRLNTVLQHGVDSGMFDANNNNALLSSNKTGSMKRGLISTNNNDYNNVTDDGSSTSVPNMISLESSEIGSDDDDADNKNSKHTIGRTDDMYNEDDNIIRWLYARQLHPIEAEI